MGPDLLVHPATGLPLNVVVAHGLGGGHRGVDVLLGEIEEQDVAGGVLGLRGVLGPEPGVAVGLELQAYAAALRPGVAAPTAWEDDNFDIRFAFFGRTDMEIRLRVLEGRRMRLQERLDRVQQQLSLTEKEVDRYSAELQRHGVESAEREVQWLSDLINAERTQAASESAQATPQAPAS